MGSKVLGIDFSGAKDAGKHIWIAEGLFQRGILAIESLLRIAETPYGSRHRDEAVCYLKWAIANSGTEVIGIDFPFAIPREITQAAGCSNWISFATNFGSLFESPDDFQAKCTVLAMELSNGKQKEIKRCTDLDARTPFSPYNRRIIYQTYHGIRDVLAPLISDGSIRVIPMQQPDSKVPTVVEICPASTLIAFNCRPPYKGKSPAHRRGRSSIIDCLQAQQSIGIADRFRKIAIDDPNGDALDAIIACIATDRARAKLLFSPEWNAIDKMEGHVFV